MRGTFLNNPFGSFADDAIVRHKSEKDARLVLEAIRRILQIVGLSVTHESSKSSTAKGGGCGPPHRRSSSLTNVRRNAGCGGPPMLDLIASRVPNALGAGRPGTDLGSTGTVCVKPRGTPLESLSICSASR
jgi:hypothetical protein